MTAPIIALDADGVLLDYNLAYAKVWERAFGAAPRERDPHAYWAADRWDVERLDARRLERFRRFFDETFWSSLPPLAGALAACEVLARAGHELVCVSALPPHFVEARRRNLRELGFPIARVIATGSAGESTKAAAVESLDPAAFVDDYLPNLSNVPATVHTALIARGPNGSPNAGPLLQAVHSQHADLAGFARWWLTAETTQEQKERYATRTQGAGAACARPVPRAGGRMAA